MAATRTSFQPGKRHPRWRGGFSVNHEGYHRIKAGPNRDKLAHRVVIEGLLRNPIGLCFSGDGKIPAGFTVDHIDHCRTHNCQGNLLLLQKCIHDAISWAHRSYIDRHWEEYCAWTWRQNEDPPEWVTETTV